jgi:hypothetical protein
VGGEPPAGRPGRCARTPSSAVSPRRAGRSAAAAARRSAGRSATAAVSAGAAGGDQPDANVPERTPRSCPPPWVSGSTGSPRRSTATPTPCGPRTCAPTAPARRPPRADVDVEVSRPPGPRRCAAAPPARPAPPRAPATSLTAPSSLLAAITLTSAVSGRTASSTARPRRPVGSGARPSGWQSPRSASHRAGSSTAGCSTAVVTRCGTRAGAPAAHTTPLTARLSASVPPEVNTTSCGEQPSAARPGLARLLDHGPGALAGRGGSRRRSPPRATCPTGRPRLRARRGGGGVVEVGAPRRRRPRSAATWPRS